MIMEVVGIEQAHGAVGGSTVLDPDSDPDSGASEPEKPAESNRRRDERGKE